MAVAKTQSRPWSLAGQIIDVWLTWAVNLGPESTDGSIGLVLPDYSGACVSNIVPTLLAGMSSAPPWFPAAAFDARQVVLLVLDGLGWDQLATRHDVAPHLASMAGSAITTVCPTTTATALTSIATGLPPGEHGVVGYRIRTDGSVLNALRWQLDSDGDARSIVLPEDFQPHEPFLGHPASVIPKSEFAPTGFTRAHLRGGVWAPWSTPSGIAAEVGRRLSAGDDLVYAYYDGIDHVSHLHGLGEHFDEELSHADSLVARVANQLVDGAALLVTADHGQVHVGDDVRQLPRSVLDLTASLSGEGRFRWLHAKPGAEKELLDSARQAFGEVAWVVDVDTVVDDGWFGPVVTSDARQRLGDVAIVPFEPVAIHDPVDTGNITLIGRHGSMTSAEVLVPLLVANS